MNKERTENIQKLFKNWSGEESIHIEAMPQSGSDRQYFRVSGNTKQAIAVYNVWSKENKTFINYTRHFRKIGVNLPDFFAEDHDKNIYLLEDLGDKTLLNFLETNRKGDDISEKVIELYKKSLSGLAFMQIKGINGLDIEKYHSPASFDKQAMKWVSDIEP